MMSSRDAVAVIRSLGRLGFDRPGLGQARGHEVEEDSEAWCPSKVLMGEELQRKTECFDGLADAHQIVERVADIREGPPHAGTRTDQAEHCVW